MVDAMPSAPSSSYPRGRRGRGRQVTPLQATGLFAAFVASAAVGGVLLAGLAMPAVAGISGIAKGSTQVFDSIPTDLDLNLPLSEKSYIYASDGTTLLATYFDENRIVVPMDQISQHLRDAVIAVEDQRFYDHGGVDPEGMLRALVKNSLQDQTAQGASTLTQQYVKNVLLEAAQRIPDEAEREQAIKDAKAPNYERKLREAKLAISIEDLLTKDEILERYLNIAQFGVPGLYGVEAAAERYFGVSAAQVTIAQAATIAGITQSPTKYDPISNPENAETRRNIVLRLMHEQGKITDAEYDEAHNTPLKDTLNVQPTQRGCANSGIYAYFCEYVTRVILNDETFGATAQDRSELLNRGGLKIVTTLDLGKQQAAHDTAMASIPATDPSEADETIVSVEPGTGKILAMSQNSEYSTDPDAPGTTALNLNVDMQHGGSEGFQPGSSAKVFVLATWLAQGHSLNETVNANRQTWHNGDFTECGKGYRGLPADGWNPANSEANEGGTMTVLHATADSVNTAFTRMGSMLDLCDIRTTTENLGVTPANGTTTQTVPSMVIGAGSYYSPLSMAAAYAAFAAQGNYCEPIAIASITAADGTEMPVPSANCRQALPSSVANAVTYALAKVMDDGTGKKARLSDRPSAGKTGTTNLSTHTWFVGYTPQLATAVWVGHESGNVPMRDVTVNGKFYDVVYGNSIAAPAWQAYMNKALAGAPVQQFSSVDNSQLYGKRVAVPDVKGQSVEAATSTLQAEQFKVQVSPTQVYSDAPAGTVASTSPSGQAYPNTTISLNISMGPDPAGSQPPAGEQPGSTPANTGPTPASHREWPPEGPTDATVPSGPGGSGSSGGPGGPGGRPGRGDGSTGE